MSLDINALNIQATAVAQKLNAVRRNIALAVIAQDDLIDSLLIALITGGHVLIEGMPGLAKTLTVTTLAQSVSATFHRLQFTPDLLPADLIGTLIYNPKEGVFTTRTGPIFANLILADEINRAPAKVQSALLEAMQERQVTIGDTSYPLPSPFMVLATQNPVEQEGTYPLPEAQVDRFMFKLLVDYPEKATELDILLRCSSTRPAEAVQSVITTQELLEIRQVVDTVYMDKELAEYIVNLVDCTRHPEAYGLKQLQPMIQYGASPRATIALAQAARARALLSGRGYILPEDIKQMAPNVLRHRLILTYEAEAEEQTADQLLAKILDTVLVP